MPKRRQPGKARRKAEQGLTLVELIVVLTIIALMSAVAIPGISRMMSSSDSLSRESRELFSMLSAARVYAATWNVRTAVVYNLDHYQLPQQNPRNEPLPGGASAYRTDSLNGASVRYIDAACMMYALPGSGARFAAEVVELKRIGNENPGADLKTEDLFVPMYGTEGNWQPFEDNICMTLINPAQVGSAGYGQVYGSERPRFNVYEDRYGTGVGALGLYPGLPVILDYDSFIGSVESDVSIPERVVYLDRFVAHVFTPDGRLDSPRSEKERFTVYMSYRPDEPLEIRLTDPNVQSFIFPDETTDPANPVLNLRVRPIEITRSTGRVKIAS